MKPGEHPIEKAILAESKRKAEQQKHSNITILQNKVKTKVWLVCVCSYCPEKEEITLLEQQAGNETSHGICDKCYDLQMEIMDREDEILKLTK